MMLRQQCLDELAKSVAFSALAKTVIYCTLSSMTIVKFYGAEKQNRGENASVNNIAIANKQTFKQKTRE